jgi:hypothetical protein
MGERSPAKPKGAHVSTQNRRSILAGLLSTILVVAVAALGGVGLASGSVSAAQNQYSGQKVTICHKGKNTITVSQAALKAHLAHGDTLLACQNGHKKNKGKRKGESNHAPNPATGTGTSTSTDQSATHGKGKGK